MCVGVYFVGTKKGDVCRSVVVIVEWACEGLDRVTRVAKEEGKDKKSSLING